MKLVSFVPFVTMAMAQDESQTVTISDKEKQKIGHLKKNWPVMLDLFFKDEMARRPAGAARFADNMKLKMAKWHDVMVDKWHECGRASMDDSFERMLDEPERFNREDPFKGMTQLTNKYKEWIERQIHNGCETQAREQHYLNRVKLYARMLRYKYCKYVSDANTEICNKVATNPRRDI